MKLSQLKIDPEFQSKIPPLQFEEEQQLEPVSYTHLDVYKRQEPDHRA